jgi:hypothetical protein
MAKRTKYVFQDNDQIAHIWIGHNLSGEGQNNARNPRGNFYFRNETIYSYGSHFPIASFVSNGKRKAIQLTTRTYSPTTFGHVSTVRSAIQGNKLPVFHLQFPSDGKNETARGIKDYLSRITYAIEDQKKSRATRNIQNARETALTNKAECIKFCRFWKVKPPKFPVIPGLPKDFASRQSRERILQTERDTRKAEERRIAREKWEKENAERLAKYRAKVEEWNTNIEQHITDWLNGGSLNQPAHGYYFNTSVPEPLEVPTLLRIMRDEVETSRYASFPIAHAKRGLALVRAVMARGEEWKANEHTCKLGLYQIQRITADGTVYAGCHVVPWSSIARIAPALDAYEVKNEVTK